MAQAVTLRIDGLDTPLQLCLHGEADQHVSRSLREYGVWEPFETRLLLDALRPGDTFLDVGANLGYFSVLAAARVGPGGRVFAVEPEARNLDLLRQNVSLNLFDDRVTVADVAFSDRSARARLYLNPDNPGDHQLHPDTPGRADVAVDTVPGAQWLAGRASRVDVVKLDVQGAEYRAVSGLLPLLRASLPQLSLLVELSPRSLRQSGHSGRELIGLLAQLQLGFAIVDHIEHRLVPTDAEALATWCDNVDGVKDDAGFMNIYLAPGIYSAA